MILTPEGQNPPKLTPTVVFDVSELFLKQLSKARSIMEHDEIAIIGDGKSLWLESRKSHDHEGNTFRSELGDTDKTFSVVMEAGNAKVLSGNYTVTIDKELCISHWKTEGLEFWIALLNKN